MVASPSDAVTDIDFSCVKCKVGLCFAGFAAGPGDPRPHHHRVAGGFGRRDVFDGFELRQQFAEIAVCFHADQDSGRSARCSRTPSAYWDLIGIELGRIVGACLLGLRGLKDEYIDSSLAIGILGTVGVFGAGAHALVGGVSGGRVMGAADSLLAARVGHCALQMAVAYASRADDVRPFGIHRCLGDGRASLRLVVASR